MKKSSTKGRDRTTIYIFHDQIRALKQIALNRETTLTVIIEEALEQYLKSREEGK